MSWGEGLGVGCGLVRVLGEGCGLVRVSEWCWVWCRWRVWAGVTLHVLLRAYA